MENADTDVEHIYRWIDSHQISRQKKCIHRDFSDAVPLAEILKSYYPKLVELHNYSPKNAVNLKLVNWQTLNKKVLSRIGYPLDRETMDRLAQSAPGAIEKVLQDLKRKIDKLNDAKGRSSKTDGVLELDGFDKSDDSVLEVKVRNGSKVRLQKLIPAAIYDDMQRNLANRDETVAGLRNKIEHLEALVAIKDERIKDLTDQLSTYDCSLISPKNDRKKRAIGGRFFGNT